MIDTILFDLDNTLIDRDAAFRRFCDDLLAEFAADWQADQLSDLRAEMIRRDEVNSSRRAWCDWLAARLDAGGPAANELDANELHDRLLRRLPLFVEPDNEVLALVERLQSQFRLAVVTNGGSTTQRAKLRRSRLAERIKSIFVSGELGIHKPAPAIFQIVLSRLNAAAGSTLFVGDDPVCDIAPARRLGMSTCWISRGREFPAAISAPSWIAGGVLELPQLLDLART